MRLEDMAAGGILAGLDADGTADVIAVRWIGRDAVDVAYRVNGATRSRLLMRSEEPLLSATAPANRVSLDGDGALFRLAAEATTPFMSSFARSAPRPSRGG
jgi:hypothetical protein